LYVQVKLQVIEHGPIWTFSYAHYLFEVIKQW